VHIVAIMPIRWIMLCPVLMVGRLLLKIWFQHAAAVTSPNLTRTGSTGSSSSGDTLLIVSHGLMGGSGRLLRQHDPARGAEHLHHLNGATA
jgi:hypothetical protein